jgi:hypothetical protein
VGGGGAQPQHVMHSKRRSAAVGGGGAQPQHVMRTKILEIFLRVARIHVLRRP